jgi:type VI secretion system secreted protein Hcp
MAFDAFMKIDGIPGESQDDKHKDWIEILSYQLGSSQPVSSTASSAGGAGTGRVNIAPVTISKLVDKSSPKLWDACNTGKHISKVIIEAHRSGGDKQKYLEITMEQVLVANYTQGGGDDFPLEIVSFAPGKISMTYVHQKREDGISSGNVSAGWDLTRNTAV